LHSKLDHYFPPPFEGRIANVFVSYMDIDFATWLALFCAEEGFLLERVIRYKGRGIGIGWIGIGVGVGRKCNAQLYLLSIFV
jgi:hypothetical protein